MTRAPEEALVQRPEEATRRKLVSSWSEAGVELEEGAADPTGCRPEAVSSAGMGRSLKRACLPTAAAPSAYAPSDYSSTSPTRSTAGSNVTGYGGRKRPVWRRKPVPLDCVIEPY